MSKTDLDEKPQSVKAEAVVHARQWGGITAVKGEAGKDRISQCRDWEKLPQDT